MTWSVNQLRRWLDEVEPIADGRTPFEWLEIPPTASTLAVQEGYHRVARTRHPDLFRLSLDAAEMDRLVRMYSRISWAYAELRDPDRCANLLRQLRGTGTHPTVASSPGSRMVRPRPASDASSLRPPARPPPSSPERPSGSPSMNPRAIVFYERAQLALRNHDRITAALNLRMARAADPGSTFLRDAIAALERKRP